MKCLIVPCLTLLTMMGFNGLCICQPAAGNCFIISITDGDSFKALYNGSIITCRLSNIDAPELKQAMGIAARDTLQQLILRRSCYVTILKKDLYGRTLVTIRYLDTDVQAYMVTKGLAWVNTRYGISRQLQELETTAKADSIGLWRCPKSIPPWVYRGLSSRSKKAFARCN